MRLIRFMLPVLILLCCTSVSAQFGKPPKDTTKSTLRKILDFQVLPVNLQREIRNAKHNYHVLFIDSTRLEVNSKIHLDTTVNKTYLLYTDKSRSKSDPAREQRIYADSTLSLMRKGPDIGVISGFSHGGYWFFKIIDGRIKLYSPFSEKDQATNDATIIAILAMQVEDGPLEAWDPKKLFPLFKNIEKCHVMYLEKRYVAAVKRYNKVDGKETRRSF
ncbi:MAG: hypothetical protein ACTHMC_27545 [Pseudobacter sp.]|uniref:hypothetical protein n=1 Tax=Pseudobacter sp. TaxID=2045420 RepID=UPI003F7F3059